MEEDTELRTIEERACGKPIMFNPRHHWIYEWIKAQPGKYMTDKLFGIVDAAYRAAKLEEGRASMAKFYSICEVDNNDNGNAMLAYLGTALDAFYAAGRSDLAKDVHSLYRGVVFQIAEGTRKR